MCRKLLVHSGEDGSPSLVGEIAHIVGEKESAARGKSLYTGGRNDPDNLILLCREHHKIVDDHEIFYSADRLRQLRADYLDWLESQLNSGRRRPLPGFDIWAADLAHPASFTSPPGS